MLGEQSFGLRLSEKAGFLELSSGRALKAVRTFASREGKRGKTRADGRGSRGGGQRGEVLQLAERSSRAELSVLGDRMGGSRGQIELSKQACLGGGMAPGH